MDRPLTTVPKNRELIDPRHSEPKISSPTPQQQHQPVGTATHPVGASTSVSLQSIAPTPPAEKSPVTTLFEDHMLAKGCSLEELKAKTKAMGGTYVEAEARDQKLDEVNDIQGAIVFDREHFNTPLPERLPVLKDTVVRDGVAHELYFVLKYTKFLVTYY